MKASTGIHHVTAIASDSQTNLDFYTGVLGLRLVKLTVNFDDPTSYHFYYGNRFGEPGTIITFFPWPGGVRTHEGRGEVNTTVFAVPQGSLPFWQERLQAAGVATQESAPLNGAETLAFRDPDGLKLELIASETAEGDASVWTRGGVGAAHAIRRVHSVRVHVANYGPTAQVLTDELGFTATEMEGRRFVGPVEIVETPAAHRAGGGVGSVHHVAFRADDIQHQAEIRSDLVNKGFHVSPVMDRSYFESIYFREGGGVLFEVATDGPGFATDEDEAHLGQNLRLPPQYENYRDQIETRIAPVRLPEIANDAVEAQS